MRSTTESTERAEDFLRPFCVSGSCTLAWQFFSRGAPSSRPGAWLPILFLMQIQCGPLKNMKDRFAWSHVNERGFTLIELLTSLSLVAVLMTLGAGALRTYWLRQGLERSSEVVVTEMRGAQQRAMAESHPVVYGLRFTPGSSNWSIVQFDPRKSSTKCVEVERQKFPTKVNVSTVSFTDAGEPTSSCRSAFGSSSQFAFFFARGTATAGSLTLRSPYVDSIKNVDVYGVTGRAEERGE